MRPFVLLTSSFYKLYFQINNIERKSKIEFIRNNTFYLYIVLLTTIKLGETKYETDRAFNVIKSTKIEKLYNLVITGNTSKFTFIYSDGTTLLEPINVTFDYLHSDVPTFNEYGQISKAKFRFNHENNDQFSLITERIYPEEIWYFDKNGIKKEIS